MARFILDNLTPKQAQVFADYFEGQGEQDCEIWFEENDTSSPTVDVSRKDWLTRLPNGDIIVQCKRTN